MATSFEAMGSAIYGRLAPVQGSAVFDMLAPAEQPSPYTIFQRLTDIDEYAFGTARIENLQYLIKAVDNGDWPHRAYARYGVAHDAIQDAPLTIPGYREMRFRRTATINYADNLGYWHVGGIYSAVIVKG